MEVVRRLQTEAIPYFLLLHLLVEEQEEQQQGITVVLVVEEEAVLVRVGVEILQVFLRHKETMVALEQILQDKTLREVAEGLLKLEQMVYQVQLVKVVMALHR